jgi:hypothetical protein
MNQICLRPWEPDPSFHVKTHRVLSFLEFYLFFDSGSPSWFSRGWEPWNQFSVWFSLKMRTIDSQCVWELDWEPVWEPDHSMRTTQYWSLHQVKPLVTGITKIGSALNYCLMHFSFGNALNLGLYHTLKWCIPKEQSLKLGIIFVQNIRGVLHHCWPVIKNGNR